MYNSICAAKYFHGQQMQNSKNLSFNISQADRCIVTKPGRSPARWESRSGINCPHLLKLPPGEHRRQQPRHHFADPGFRFLNHPFRGGIFHQFLKTFFFFCWRAAILIYNSSGRNRPKVIASFTERVGIITVFFRFIFFHA